MPHSEPIDVGSRKEKMPPAMRRYLVRLFSFMALYGITLCFALWYFIANQDASGAMAYVMGALPALPIIGVFWTIGKLMAEMRDEYQRLLMTRQILVATGFMLSIATLWGFLEQFELVFHIPAYYWAVLWFAGLGLGSWVNRLTLGSSSGPSE